MPGQSIFADEWRECLRAHYMYVVRVGDQITERTLRGVMHSVGFTADELKELYVLATAHIDDVGADFVPDMEVLAAETPAPPALETDMKEAEDEDELPQGDPGVTQLSLF